MANLIEAIQKAIVNSRELLDAYRDLGPTGAFGMAAIGLDIAAAEKAIGGGDCVAMVISLKTLREHK